MPNGALPVWLVLALQAGRVAWDHVESDRRYRCPPCDCPSHKEDLCDECPDCPVVNLTACPEPVVCPAVDCLSHSEAVEVSRAAIPPQEHPSAAYEAALAVSGGATVLVFQKAARAVRAWRHGDEDEEGYYPAPPRRGGGVVE